MGGLFCVKSLVTIRLVVEGKKPPVALPEAKLLPDLKEWV
jgi:hypothetical protein